MDTVNTADWNNTWTIATSSSSLPFFAAQQTVTATSAPTFTANGPDAPTFTHLRFHKHDNKLKAHFTYQGQKYKIIIHLTPTGNTSTLQANIKNRNGSDGIEGLPVATWTTDDGAS